MKRTALPFLSFTAAIKTFSRKVICLAAGILLAFSAFATNYYNITGSANANNLASWTTDAGGGAGTAPANFTSGDIFTIRAATTLNTNAAWTVSGTGSGIVIAGTLTLSNPLTVNGSFTNNGTFNNGNQLVTFGTGGDIAGSSGITFFNLTINTTSTTDIVTLSKAAITIRGGNGAANGRLTLNQGVFKVGAGNTISFDNNSSENSIFNPNATGASNFATTGTNGADGGKIVALNGSGARLTIGGAGLTTFYDLSIGTTVGNGNRTIVQANPNVLINGTLTILDNQGKWQNNSPAWGPASTLSRNNNGLQYSPGGGDTREWTGMATGTIGVTPGYPNNVIVMNVGTSASNYSGETYGMRLSGTWSINGTLQAGSSTAPGYVDLGPGTSFSCGGIIIENNSRLRGADAAGSFIVKGNFLRTGSTNGVFNASNGVVNFSGNGTQASPQTITAANGSATLFNSITISNGTYVKLNSPATVGTAGICTLTSGIIETSTTNILTVNNTAPAAIAGGGAATFINGPAKWSLAATTTNNYVFPLGKNTSYLPFVLLPNTTTDNAVIAEAFASDCGGTPDNVTVNSISRTEYWSLSASPAFTTSLTSVSVARPAAIGLPFNALAKSSAAAGVYSAVGGTVAGNAVNLSAGIGTGSPLYFVIAEAPLSITIVSVTAPTCVPGSSGSITVAGSGGTPPYQYQLDNNGFSANNVFTNVAEGDHRVTIRDAANTTVDTMVTVSAIILTKDTSICASVPVNLSASGPGVNYTWTANTAPAVAGLSGTTGQNVTATPTATTTYTVTADIYDASGNKLTNGGFEAGNTGFISNYIHHTCGAYYSSTNTNAPSPWPCAGNTPPGPYPVNHNGLYKISGNARDLCVNLANFGAHSGSNMMIIDGANDGAAAAAAAWSQTVNGLTAGTRYIFSYWVRNAFSSIDGNAPVLRVKINGTDLVATGSPNPYTVNTLLWTQLTYDWVATGTTATIELFDEKLADASNDFALDDFEFIGPCQVTKSVTITVSSGGTPAPAVTTPVNYCQNAAASPLTATGTGLLWYTAATGGTGSATAPTPSTAAAGNTTYYVSQTGTCGESPRASIIVAVNASTAAPAVTDPSAYCQNATAASLAANATGTGLLWYTAATGGTGDASAPTPSTATVGTTTYYVSQSGSCGESPRAGITVTVNAVPAADAGNFQTIAPGGSVTLNATASAGTYSWNPITGLSSGSVLNPVASPSQTTRYTLTVTATGGCSASDTVTVAVNATGDCFSVPGIFTPNNDGFYDKWILFTGACLKKLEVNVYNRWGGLVYQAQNYDNSWDGTRAGKPLPDATYYYVINAFYNDGRQKRITGNVTIMR